MRFLLDANACILLFKGNGPMVARVSRCDEGDIGISAIAFAEVALGSWNGKAPALYRLDPFRSQFPVLPFDDLAAKIYAGLPFRRGSFDRLIAAHALSLNLALITANVGDFADIPDLRVEDWTLPL